MRRVPMPRRRPVAEVFGAPTGPDSTPPPRRSAVLAASTIDNLMPVAVGLCLFYAIITVLHLLLQHGTVLYVMAPVAALSSVTAGVVGWRLRHRSQVGSASGPAWVALLGAIAMANSVLHLALTEDPKQTTTVMMSLTLVAAVLHNRWWSIAVIGSGVLGWLLVALTSPRSPDWIHFGISMLMALAIAGFLYYSRTRTVLRLAEAERRLREIAHTDELTGLLNRRGLLVRGEQLLSLAHADGRSPAAVFVDVDGLKQVNDLQGHEAGDRLIAAVGQILRQSVPAEVLISRWGGDEFAILLPSADVAAVTALISRIEAQLAGAGIEVSAGGGFAGPAGGGLSELLAQADQAMYGVKQRRRRSRTEGSADVPAHQID